MAADAGMPCGELWRAIGAAVAIVPALGEVIGGLRRGVAIDRTAEAQHHAVLVGVEADRQAHRIAGVAHALEAAVVDRVGSPAGHAGNIELAVAWIESAAMRAGQELAD